MNSRAKGARGEREFAQFLRGHGYNARRGQQYAGGPDSPDVVHSLAGFHFEVKRVESLSLYPAMQQAIRDAGIDVPVVAHRRNQKQWLAVLPMDEFLKLVVYANNPVSL